MPRSPDDFAEWLSDLTDEERKKVEAKVTKLDHTRERKPKVKRGNGAAASGAQPGWLALCLVDDKGRFFGNLANVMIALRADPSVEGVFAFDEMAQTAMLMRPVPVAPNGGAAGGPAAEWRRCFRTDRSTPLKPRTLRRIWTLA